MGLFTKREETWTKESLVDYVERAVDKAEIKSTLSSEIDEIKYMKLAIKIVSSYIAAAISTCEFKFYDKNGLAKKDAYYYKLNVSPNPNDTATRLKYNMVQQLIDTGESLVIENKNKIYFATKFSICNDYSINGYEFDNVQIDKTTLDKKFNRKTSFYFKLDEKPINDLLKTIDDKYNKLLKIAIKTYGKSISNKWKLKIDQVKSGAPDFQKEFENIVKKDLKEFIETDASVYPETNGYQLEKLDVASSASDSSDIRNIRKDIFDMVAQAFKMPPSMMYGNITNLKDVANQFITFAVKPIASVIGEEITRSIYSEKEIIEDDKRVVVDISTITYRDIFDVAKGLDKLISDGVANIDEVRPLVSLPVLNTPASKQYWITKNYGKIEDSLNPTNEPDNTNDDDNEDDNIDDEFIDKEHLEGGDIDEGQE